MKKIFTLVLIIALALASLVSCSINDSEIQIIWGDLDEDFTATVKDAFDRALYIENIAYENLDADGSASAQIDLIKETVAAGASVLVVNPLDLRVATEALETAKEADIPVIFVCGGEFVSNDLFLSGYDKAYAVDVDYTTLFTTLGERVASDLIENYEDYDRNDDGRISYSAFGLSALAAPIIDLKLAEANLPALVKVDAPAISNAANELFGDFEGKGSNEKLPTKVELILTADDADVAPLLLDMRNYDLNYNKLTTHFIPLYTVGNSANASILLPDTAEEEEKAAYSVLNTIDSGYVSAAALEDDDAIATSVALMLRNIIKGYGVLEGLSEDIVFGNKLLIPYTIYG